MGLVEGQSVQFNAHVEPVYGRLVRTNWRAIIYDHNTVDCSLLAGVRASKASMVSQTFLQQSVREQLLQAREILELGLKNVSYARQVVALTDGKSIADVSWVKVSYHKACSDDLNLPIYAPSFWFIKLVEICFIHN